MARTWHHLLRGSWLAGTVGVSLAGLSVGPEGLAGGPPAARVTWPNYYTAQARHSVFRPLMDQAHNGLILDQTLWNYHWDLEAPEELHRMGMAQLDRLAKRHIYHCEGPLRLHLQVSHDVRYDPQDRRKVQEKRVELTRKRLEAVVAYMTTTYPSIAFTISVHDPRTVGMSGQEAHIPVERHVRDARGFIPPELVTVVSITPRGLGGPGGGASPPPPLESAPGQGNASALGSGALDPGSGGGEGGP